jgi:Ricin-type beta-trefoil lectin domain/Putative Ig domain
MRIRPVVSAVSAMLAVAALSTTAAAASSPAVAPAQSFRHSCSATPTPGRAECLALVRTSVPSFFGTAAGLSTSGYGPADLQSAYGLALASAAAGRGATVALVDAFDDPNAASDLAVYRTHYHLPACTVANGCFRTVNQEGNPSPLPAADPGWAEEESLDIDMVSAICPNCHILLVEADDNTIANLAVAADTASLGAGSVSNSYGASEFNGEGAQYDAYYEHAGVAVTASAGDTGYGVEYPAASPHVTSAGGTSLRRSGGTARGWSETAWGTGPGDGTGSGCSAYEAKPSWQADTGCSGRTVADVSADADPSTGVAVYDSYGGDTGWEEFGGTSVASPVIASVYALAGPPGGGYPASFPYGHPTHLYDVTSGSNGSCSPAYLCTAGTGYDGPTGLGTPAGTAAFMRLDTTVSVTNPGLRHATKGAKITSLAIAATDSQPGQALRFTASGLPPGLSISAGGVITGTPTARGYYTATVRATDGRGITGSAAFKWAVRSIGAVRSGLAGKCLDDWRASTASRNKIDIYTCNGGRAQAWSVSVQANGSLQISLLKSTGECLTVTGGAVASGTKAELLRCGAAGQQWRTGAYGHLVNPQSGKCLADPGAGRNGTQLEIIGCANRTYERWTLP